MELPALERRVAKSEMAMMWKRRALKVQTVEGETFLFVFDGPERIEEARMALDQIEGP